MELNIPEHLLHQAVYDTLGDCMLEGGGHRPYNFRCPICGDSKKNKNKKRGYVMFDDQKFVYVCHNECGSMSFLNRFLKDYHNDIYRSIIWESLKDNGAFNHIRVADSNTPIEKTNIANVFKEGQLKRLTDDHHLAKKGLEYCLSRSIPYIEYSKWFVCVYDDKFFERNADGSYRLDERGLKIGNEYANRLIIPYYRYGGTWVQFDARSLEEDPYLRYRNLSSAEREMYNIDFVNTAKPFFMLEGAIDSVFLRNSLAFGGTKHLDMFLKRYDYIEKNIKNCVIIWDNDDAGYDCIYDYCKRGYRWFDWSLVEIKDEFKIGKNGLPRKIKDLNDVVLYCHVDLDSNGYIKPEWILSKSKMPNLIDVVIKYGNRDKIRQKTAFENRKKLKEKIYNNNKTFKISFKNG